MYSTALRTAQHCKISTTQVAYDCSEKFGVLKEKSAHFESLLSCVMRTQNLLQIHTFVLHETYIFKMYVKYFLIYVVCCNRDDITSNMREKNIGNSNAISKEQI